MKTRKQKHQLDSSFSNLEQLFAEMYRQKFTAQVEAEKNTPWYTRYLKKLSYKLFNLRIRIRRWVHR